MADYIERENLLDGLTSPEFGLDEIIDNLILEHNLDFLHDNDEDAVREFAKDLIGSIKNYIKTEPATNEKIKCGKWIEKVNSYNYSDEDFEYLECSVCGNCSPVQNLTPYCSECGAKMESQ